jgi:hypothetical protein
MNAALVRPRPPPRALFALLALFALFFAAPLVLFAARVLFALLALRAELFALFADFALLRALFALFFAIRPPLLAGPLAGRRPLAMCGPPIERTRVVVRRRARGNGPPGPYE